MSFWGSRPLAQIFVCLPPLGDYVFFVVSFFFFFTHLKKSLVTAMKYLVFLLKEVTDDYYFEIARYYC
jgi:hypothetical protein